MSTVLAEARPSRRVGRALLTAVAGLLFGLGWLASVVVWSVWLGLCWCAAAVAVGWSQARLDRPGRGS